MKIKDLFNKTIPSASLNALGEEVESYKYISAWKKDKDRFVPAVDFSKVENFARFGSAEQYYEDAIKRIYATYPYDGSLFERLDWQNSASYFDNYIFENEYPRTNGYVIFSAHSGGVGAYSWGTKVDAYNGYGVPASGAYEYISIQGGPHTSKRVKGKDIQDESGDYKDGYANILDLGKGRESNLKLDGTTGNTVEFWMKKSEFLPSLTNKEVIFDVALTTLGGTSAEDYARLTIEMSGGQGYSDSPFYITYMSGTENAAGFATASIGSGLTTGSIADGSWHHYAFTFKNIDSNLEAKLYINGKCNHTITGGVENLYKGSAVSSETLTSTVEYISGSLTGTIGALCAGVITGSGYGVGEKLQAGLGWGKLSASIDDFRFWKTKRSSKDIGLNYFRDVGGGANTDTANTDLGVYYKFNEGITQTSSVDQTILDYSGRICNGTYTGYKSATRSTGSAMVESSASVAEFKDPILYPFHNSVSSYNTKRTKVGFEYDVKNNSSIFQSIPAWIIEEDEAYGDLNVKKLTQVMASYFDSLWLQIDSLNKIKDEAYFSGSFKPTPYGKRLLQERGLVTPELFTDATIVEQMLHQDHNDSYTDKIHNLKNLIYQNIYNNLIYIYKSKGTEKSFRNLIRCFGVDDELIKFNIYGHNVTYDIKDNFRDTTIRKNYIDFYTSDTSESTVYQMTASNNLNSTSYLSGAANSGSAMTFETEVIFPKLWPPNEEGWISSNFSTASIFGIHTPFLNTEDEGDTAWNSPDYANFQVHTVRKTTEQDIIKGLGYTNTDVRFMLTSSNDSLAIELTSSTFRKVYDNKKWNFAVRVLPAGHPQSYRLGGTHFGNQDYKVEFYGVSVNKGIIENSFYVTGTTDYFRGISFITGSKRLYVGAERTDFSGALVTPADSRISSTRMWTDYLSNGVINAHARDASNYGTLNAYWHAFPGQLTNIYIPQMETLALHWNFSQVSSSNDDGVFSVADISSGSTALIDRYGRHSHLVNKQHTGIGYKFPTSIEATRRSQGSTVVVKEFVQSSKQTIPENLHTSDTVKVIESETEDDTVFTRETRPISLFFTFEKSMYQVVSEEMINFFATIVDFNNLIGEPVNRYRQEYKDLSKLRQLFFDKIGNTPNLAKFIDYYKWIDSALGIFLEQLMPASAEHGQGLRNMVESHVLERNKYWTKFPTLEMKQDDPEARLFGINEMLYDWKHGHYDNSDNQTKQCLWWKDRAERDRAATSGDSGIDDDRKKYLAAITSKNVSGSVYTIRSFTRPYQFRAEKGKIIHGGINFSENKKLDYINTLMRKVDSTYENSLRFHRSDLLSSSTDLCLDNPELDTKSEFTFGATGSTELKGELIAPFNILDQDDVGTTVKSPDHPPPNSRIVNFHHDTYGDDKETPMQSPFTEKFVGGRQHRHVWNFASLISTSSHHGGGTTIYEDITTRPEGWRLGQSTSQYKLINPTYDHNSAYKPDLPRAVFYRDETAKRPINIRNIQQTTGSSTTGYFTYLGNYTHDYEIVQTVGRSTNNRALVDQALHWEIFAKQYGAITGHVDFALPDRSVSGSNKFVFVNRFSAPGGPETMGEGFLDVEAGEYSVYNALPWRNLSVRLPLQELLTNHMKGGGYHSDAQNSSSWNRAIKEGFIYPGAYAGVSGTISAYTYEGTGSHHKINKNGTRILKFEGKYGSIGGRGYVSEHGTVVTSSRYDNWHIQHPIPQSDMQYSWITASAVNAIYGYEQPDHSLANQASTDIEFLSTSEFGSFYNLGLNVRRWGADQNSSYPSNLIEASRLQTDFVGLNYHVISALSSSNNRIGWPLGTPYLGSAVALSDAQYLNRHFVSSVVGGYAINEGNKPSAKESAVGFNAIILNRGGAYGWPTWKQIRGEQNPLVKHWRRINDYNYPIYTQKIMKTAIIWPDTPLSSPPGTTVYKRSHVIKVFRGFEHVTEPPISSRFKPLVHIFRNTGTSRRLTLEYTYGNNLTYFANHNLNNLLDTHYSSNKKLNLGSLAIEDQLYNNLKAIYIDNKAEVLSDLEFKKLTYSETIFPREVNTFLGKTRGRKQYTEATETTGEENDWPMSVAAENSINRRVYAIHPNKIRNYRPLRTFWRTRKIDRARLSGRDTVTGLGPNSELDFPQQSQATWNYWSRPAGYGRDEMGTASSELSVWPLDCDFPGTIYAISQGGNCMNTSYMSNWRYSMNLPTTSSFSPNQNFSDVAGDIFCQNGALGVAQHWNIFNSAHSFHIHAFDQYTADTDVRVLARSASMCYEYPRADIVSQSLGNSDHKSHMWWATYRANKQAGRDPWYDSYGDYAEDVRLMGKDYSVIPEFRISEHMDKYLSHPIQFQMKNNEFLTIEGASIFSASSNTMEDEFYKTYSHTEFMKHFETIKKDHKEAAEPSQFTLSCKGIKKLLPYNGFYPVSRTVQLGAMLSQSFGPHIIATTGSGVDPDTLSIYGLGSPNQKIPTKWRPDGLQAFLDLFYAPGIMYNTIKSGIAVDYPALTGALVSVGNANSFTNIKNYNYTFRLPFEALINPAEYLPISSSDGINGKIIGNITNDTLQMASRLDRPHEFAWSGQSDSRYSLAANNFFGEIPKFFLKDEVFTSFVSAPEHKCDLSFVSGTAYYMDVHMYKTNDFITYEGPPKFAVSGDEGSPQGGDETPAPRVYYTIHARGAPYGFPSKIQDSSQSDIYYSPHYVSGNIGDAAYAAYTPPYFYGRAIARMVFKPDQARDMLEGTTERFTLEEVINYCKEPPRNRDKVTGQSQGGTFYFNLYDGLNADVMSSLIEQDFHEHRIPSASHENIAFRNAMAISASINLFTKTSVKKTKWEAITGKALEVEDTEGTTFDVWSVNSKFETPIMNYTGALSSDAYGDNRVPHSCDGDFHSGLSTAKVPSTSFGVWKDYGLIPNNSEGIFLQIKDSFGARSYGHRGVTGSLYKKIFKPAGVQMPKALGRLADSKEISEAIVAMPFRVVAGVSPARKNAGSGPPAAKREFISILKKDYLQPGGLSKKTMMKFLRKIINDDYSTDTFLPQEKLIKMLYGQSIFDMAKKMDKYIIPPQFDWINNKNIEPYAMYIFEFTHTLNKQELSYIWQNLMPDIAMTAVKVPGFDPFTGMHHDAPKVSHPLHFGNVDDGEILLPRELLTGEELNSELNWMVFKVKRRAEKSYFASTIDTTDDKKFKFTFDVGGKQEDLDTTYSYNWPYDFFSLVELAKIDATVDFTNPSKRKKAQVAELLKTAQELKKQAKSQTGGDDDGGVTLEELLLTAGAAKTNLSQKDTSAEVNIPLGAWTATEGHDQATTQPVESLTGEETIAGHITDGTAANIYQAGREKNKGDI